MRVEKDYRFGTDAGEKSLAEHPGSAPAVGIAIVDTATPPSTQVIKAPNKPRRTAVTDLVISVVLRCCCQWVTHP